MTEIRDRGSVLATEEGRTRLKDAQASKHNYDGKAWTYMEIATEAGVDAKTVSRFLNRKQPVDESKARAICQALGVDFSQIVEIRSSKSISKEHEYETKWREICRELLEKWKGLTTNALTTRNGVRFQLDEMFVPLGVVERRQTSRHSPVSGSPEQGSELYEEKVTPISQDDFFEQVLRQRQSKNSQGKRIAIIGEPGAGKTTQLQKIGDWILKETDGIPIWVPLAAVGTKSLREYLLDDWLKTATEELEIPQEYRDELGQLLKTGKVWLLLDGVDEMTIANALHQIATQMHGRWLQNVRVVLTCRLNVWDAGKNYLDSFDVYRNLDFDYPSEVHLFIDKWFATEPDLQQKLKLALEQPGKERIRDMVKNPLRLTLLCYSWQLRQGELPETKAGLYEWFVDTFYEWNKGKVSTKLGSAKRKELNHALGELAKEAIDQESSRFCMREKFINSFLGDADDEDSLFYLALQLGWLNCVGVAEENPLEDVYAFFHPTFQEYFAALAIDDWHYFLNHISYNPNMGSYRIFEKHWTEVILFWIARFAPDVNLQKEAFIENLINFKDFCGNSNFYGYRAYFLASYVISEYPHCKYTDEIIRYIFKLGFGNVAEELHYCIEDAAREALEKTEASRIVVLLSKTISNAKEHILTIGSETFHLRSNADHVDEAAYILTKIDPENKLAISTLTEKEKFIAAIGTALLDMNQEEVSSFANSIVWKSPFQGKPIVFKVTPDGEKVIDSLKSFKNLKKRKNIYENHISLSKKETFQEAEIVKFFIQLLCNNDDVTTCFKAIFEFKELSVGEILLKEIVKGIKNYFYNLRESDNKFFLCYGVLWYCVQNMSYPDFFDAWHSPSSVSTELPVDDGETKR